MFVLLCTALAAQPGEVQVAWSRGVRTLTATAPSGQDIAPDAPVDLSLTVGSRALTVSGDGAWLAEGIDLGKLHGPLEGELQLQLCDKASGVCAPATWRLQGLVADTRKGAVTLQASAPVTEVHADTTFNHDVNPAVDAAYARAKDAGDKVLLDFSAIWCPPCNALAAEVLHAPDADDLLKGFQVAVVDVDHLSSWPLKSRYAVGGYPTVIVTDVEGNELERIEGYPGKEAFLETLANLGQTSAFGARRDAFRAAPSAAELTSLFAAQPSQAVEILMENEAWAKTDGKQAVLDALPGLLTRVQPTVAADLLWFRAKLEDEASRPLTFATAAAVLKAGFRDTAADRASYNFYAHLVADAGDLDGAIRFLDGHTRENPHDPTFLLEAAYILNDHERYDEALKRADLAAQRSWGDIGLRVAEVACKALVGLGRADEAKARALAVLAANPAPAAELKVRTHKYREKLAKFTE